MKVNEIFYSIQGEGTFTGTPAIFIRFAGCNLKCDFCDTEHQPYQELTEDEIIAEIKKYKASHVVLTGGEPTLQITRSFVDKLHEEGKFIQIETNGTRELKDDLDCVIDWITCSPKFEFCGNAGAIKIQRFDELKVVYQGQEMSIYDDLKTRYVQGCYYVQPCDVKDERRNAEILAQTVEFIKANPKWKLSLQTQKILNVR